MKKALADMCLAVALFSAIVPITSPTETVVPFNHGVNG